MHTYVMKKGDSPLFAASAHGNVEVVKELLKFGAQVNLQTSVRCSYLIQSSFMVFYHLSTV